MQKQEVDGCGEEEFYDHEQGERSEGWQDAGVRACEDEAGCARRTIDQVLGVRLHGLGRSSLLTCARDAVVTSNDFTLTRNISRAVARYPFAGRA